MGARDLFIALWYGFKWGLVSPLHAYRAGKDYARLVAWLFGLGTLAVYPLSVIIGTLWAAYRYYDSGGPSGR